MTTTTAAASTTTTTIANAATTAAANAATASNVAARYVWSNTYANGDRYSGEVVGAQHVKDGTGEYVWAMSGATYRGTWQKDAPHGQGTLSVPGADGYTYTGAFVCGRRSGHGTCRFASGRVYSGAWLNDEMEGEGTLHGAAGVDAYREYAGSFVCGARHGAHGRCVYVNGDVYEGAWVQGRRHGHGVWHLAPAPSASSEPAVVMYKGAFVDDMPATRGGGSNSRSGDGGGSSSSSTRASVSELMYADGSSYRGHTDGLLRDGDGEHCLASGDVYTGGFAHNVRSGAGVLRCRDGRCYTGTWARGQLVGRVTYTYTSSNNNNVNEDATPVLVHYTGPVLGECELTGSDARARYADGSVYCGEVVCGQPAGQGTLERRVLPRFFAGAERGSGGGVAVALSARTDAAAAAVDGDGGSSDVYTAALAACRCCEVLLVRYEGSFYKGQPHGEGNATLQCVCSRGSDTTTPAAAAAAAAMTSMSLPRDVVGFGIDYCRDATYSGPWAHGRPHGSRGCWRWLAGAAVYTGGVEGGVACDDGSSGGGGGGARYSTAELTYDGGFAYGQACGRGRLQYLLLPGDVYEGEWRDGLAHGQGTLTQTRRSEGEGCGVCYTGSWRNGKRHGHGVERRLTRRNGSDGAGAVTGAAAALLPDMASPPLYEGEYSENARHGRGLAHDLDGTTDEGSFVCGVLCGEGQRTLPDGTRIAGSFVDGVPHGVCEVRFVQGLRFRGALQHGRLAGQGELVYANGDRYVGAIEPAASSSSSSGGGGAMSTARAHMRDGDGAPQSPQHAGRGAADGMLMPQRHGEGVYTFAEGNQLACTWRHNVLHGRGVYTTAATGERSERVYEDGVLLTRGGGGGNGVVGGGGSSAATTTTADLFTAENEYPNTLSADMLRKRMPVIAAAAAAAAAAHQQQQQHSPSVAAAASHTHDHSNTTTTTTTTTSRLRRSKSRESNAVQQQPHATPHATPRAGGNAGATAAMTTTTSKRRTTTTTTTPPNTPPPPTRSRVSVTTAAASVKTTASAAAAVSNNSNGTTTTTRQLRRTSNSSAHNNNSIAVTATAASASKTPMLLHAPDTTSTALATTSAPAASASTRTRSSALLQSKRYERAVRELQRCDNDDCSNNSNNSSGATAASKPSTRVSGGGGGAAGARHGPMRGQLRVLMDEATTIRNVHEDGIHELTEQIRQLNERIWQTRFATCATAPATPTRAAQLRRMHAERKTAVLQLLRALDVEQQQQQP